MAVRNADRLSWNPRGRLYRTQDTVTFIEREPFSDAQARDAGWSFAIVRHGCMDLPLDVMSNVTATLSDPRIAGVNAIRVAASTSMVPVEPASIDTSGRATVAPSFMTVN